MKKLLYVSIILLFSVSCANVYLKATAIDQPVVMNNKVDANFQIIRHFKRPAKAYFTIFNLVTVSNADIQKIIQEEITEAGGDAAINIKIHGQTTFIDGLLPIALGTIGGLLFPPFGNFASMLIGARTYFVEGDIIKCKK